MRYSLSATTGCVEGRRSVTTGNVLSVLSSPFVSCDGEFDVGFGVRDAMARLEFR